MNNFVTTVTPAIAGSGQTDIEVHDKGKPPATAGRKASGPDRPG
jgi:hypothetical protein